MGNRGLAMLVGAVQGLEESAKNMITLKTAKQKLEQEKEMHGADLKIKKAELDKLELLYGPEQITAEREKLKAETAAANALFTLRNIQITREQEKNKQTADTHTKTMLILDNVLRGNAKMPAGMRINSKGDWSISGQKEELDLSSLLNEDSGGMPKQDNQGSTDWWNQ